MVKMALVGSRPIGLQMTEARARLVSEGPNDIAGSQAPRDMICNHAGANGSHYRYGQTGFGRRD